MKNEIIVIVKVFVLILMSVIVGGILLTLAYMLPTDKMKENVKESISIYKWNPIESWNKNYPYYTETDMQTESIKIMEAISDEDGSAFTRAMLGDYYSYENKTPMQALVKYIKGDDGYGKISYSRYWHGYLIFLKPLLYLMSLSTIKLLNMTLQFLLCIFLAILIYDKISAYGVLAFCGFVIVLNPVTIFLSMQNDIIFYISSIASIVLLSYNEQMKRSKNSYIFLFTNIGIAVAFFDFLTYPVVSVGIPIILYILLNNSDFKGYLINIIKFSFAWILGYAGMWIGKWIVSDLLIGTDVLRNGIENIMYRTGGDPYGEVAEVDSSFLHTVVKNASVINVWPLKIFIALTFILFLIAIIRNKKKSNINKSKVASILMVSLFPFGWYYIVRNHSVIHPWIEYRELSLFVFGLICCMGLLVGDNVMTQKITEWE